MDEVDTVPNADLHVHQGNESQWSQADHRRHSWHHLHQIARYSVSLRSAATMRLRKRMDLTITNDPVLQHFTALPWFSAMVVIRGQDILFERYAADFNAEMPHSIQSITKTTMNLVIGRLVEEGIIDLARTVAHYLPEIGSGYATATVQQVLNMDVVNDYSEDFTDPAATYYRHEEAMGWRLPRDLNNEFTQRKFLIGIASADTNNRSGRMQYKDANTDVLGWLAERVSGRPLRAFLADIVDAAGLEGTFHITTDRDGVPGLDGGACLTARDLARYMALFVRRGRGVSGQPVGSARFIEQSLRSGIPMPPPFEHIRYSNHLKVAGSTVGHGGWGGQYAMANLETGVIAVFFSVLENAHAVTRDYFIPLIPLLESITVVVPK